MRGYIITTCNMIKARANHLNDEMLHHLAATLVIINHIRYQELDPDVWKSIDLNEDGYYE